MRYSSISATSSMNLSSSSCRLPNKSGLPQVLGFTGRPLRTPCPHSFSFFHRFWDGASAAYEVTGGLYMAASNWMAFAHHGNVSWEEVQGFKQTVVRLVSLLSAMMLTHLEGTDTRNSEEGYDILDLASLHMTRVRVLAKEENKTEVVIQWIKLLIIERLNVGTLSIPAPILTRVFQELDVSVGRRSWARCRSHFRTRRRSS